MILRFIETKNQSKVNNKEFLKVVLDFLLVN